MPNSTVNVLNIISPGSGTFGGIEAYLMSYYEHMDHQKIHFDFAFCGSNTMKLHMEQEVFSGSSFFELKVLDGTNNGLGNWRRLIGKIKKLLNYKHYDVVEVHTASPMIQAVCGLALKPYKNVLKIAHSHALQEMPSNLAVSLVSKGCIMVISNVYDYFFACSNAAGKMYGKKIIKSGRFKKVNNAIDSSKFAFAPQIRETIRREYGIDNGCFVIGHVARLSEEKNQVFLVDIFNEILKYKSNSKLWIVGEGPARRNIEARIEKLGIADDVKLFGQRPDVSDLLQAMDIFIITSRLEGLCISAIESQAAGLSTFVSTGVPEECKITDDFTRIELSASASDWANIIINKHDSDRRNTREEVNKNGYDIHSSAMELEEFYCNCCSR